MPRLVWSAVLAVTLLSGASPDQQTSAAVLKIVVIAGEDAVNIIQQKTAVAPVVEVRDRNDQPVAGAVVRFAIQGGRASFSGARALSVTTDIAGRAVASGLTPTASGAVQISASAAFQSQTAVITIAQTNVMTAAEAAAVGAGSAGGTSGSGAAAGGAAGGGGGLSATTIGIVGGAVAGGAIVATKALGGGTKYSGTYTGQLLLVFATCARTHNVNGTVEIEVDDPAASSVSGTARVIHTQVAISSSCPGDPFVNRTENFNEQGPLNGSPGSLTFTVQQSNSVPPPDPAGALHTSSFTFSGVLSGTSIAGTLNYSDGSTAPSAPNYAVGRAVYPVTLR